MKELIEALHVIQDECKKHDMCAGCLLYEDGCIVEPIPTSWEINDEVQKALL